MPLKAQIEAIAAGLDTANTFIYGTANEVNYTADKAVRVKPIIAMFPKQPFTTKLGVNGSAQNEFNMYLEFLFIHNYGTDTTQCEPLVNAAILLCNEFLIALSRYREGPGRYFKIPKGQRFNGMPVYNAYDAQTCGVSLTVKVVKRYDELLLMC